MDRVTLIGGGLVVGGLKNLGGYSGLMGPPVPGSVLKNQGGFSAGGFSAHGVSGLLYAFPIPAGVVYLRHRRLSKIRCI